MATESSPLTSEWPPNTGRFFSSFTSAAAASYVVPVADNRSFEIETELLTALHDDGEYNARNSATPRVASKEKGVRRKVSHATKLDDHFQRISSSESAVDVVEAWRRTHGSSVPIFVVVLASSDFWKVLSFLPEENEAQN